MLRRLGPSAGSGVGVILNGGTHRVDKLSIGVGTVPADNLFLLYETVTEVPALGQTGAVETNVTAGTGGDYSAFRVVLREMTAANNQARPLEVHMLRSSGVGDQPTQGLELTMQGNVVETVPGFWHNAIRIASLASLWGISGGVRQGNGIFIGQDENGFENGILYRSTAPEGNLDLFLVNRNGAMVSGLHQPRATSQYDLGIANNRWRAGFLENLITENGVPNGPTKTYRNDTTSGDYLMGVGRLGRTVGAAHAEELSSLGLILEKSLIGRKQAAPSTPASGYAAIGPHTDESWRGLTSGGVGFQLMDSRLLARRNRLINGNALIKQRPALSPADNTNGIDGMRLLMESASGWALTQETADTPLNGSHRAFKFTVGATPNAKGGGFWPLTFDQMADLRNGTASAQAKIKVSDPRVGDVRMGLAQWTGGVDAIAGDPVSAWGAAGTTPTLAAGWSFVSAPANLGVSGGYLTYKVENQAIAGGAVNLGLLIWCDDKATTSGDAFLVTDVQVERGAVCTEYEIRPIEQQELDCFRWLYVYTAEPLGIAQTVQLLVTDNAQTLPVPMRATPTIASGATFTANVGTAGTVSASASSRRVVRFFNSASNWTVNALISVTAEVTAEP